MANIICLWQELLCHIHEYCSLDYFISEGKHNIKHKSLSKHILLHAIAADSTFQIWFTLTIYTKVLLENKCQYSPAILVTASGRSKRHISYVQRKPRKLFYKLISIFTITTSWYFCQNSENGSAKNVPVQQHNRLSFWSLLALWAQRFDIHHLFHHVKCLLWRMH